MSSFIKVLCYITILPARGAVTVVYMSCVSFVMCQISFFFNFLLYD